MTSAFLFIELFFQIKQKTVQTLLKWLFWTSINLDIIKQNIILAEVFVSIPCAFYPMLVGLLPRVWGKRPLLPPHIFIRFLNKINNLNDLFSQNLLLH